ncbi:MAG: hypothetical protein PHQ27_10530 [Victivallales bacterium]|nr:hypothetical protein [Victivallales bacterium]
MEITDRQFRRISKLIYERAGINLTEGKKTLVQGRLSKVLHRMGCDSFDEYLDIVERDRSHQSLTELIDRIATNHTYFWRENGHFDYFSREVLPEIVQHKRERGENDLRIWCAGCSFGDEAYTLMMLMMEYFGDSYRNWTAGLLATDISSDALSRAIQGVYSADRLRELPRYLLLRYFRKNGDGSYQVAEAVRNEIVFRRFNLMREIFPFRQPFDVIFCRNVMIYFDKPTRDALVRRFAGFTVPGGYLFIGHSESIGRNNAAWEYVRPAVYRRVAAG